GILKLVNEKMSISISEFFVDKRSRLILNFVVNDVVELRNREHVLILLQTQKLLIYVIQNGERSQIFQERFIKEQLSGLSINSFESLQTVQSNFVYQVFLALRYGFGITLLRIF